MKQPFYKSNSVRQLSGAQKDAFERSYASYEKYYNSMKNPTEAKLNKDEYLQEYKGMRMDLTSRGKSVKAIPRLIANEQTHERSLFQDEAQFRALKESNLKGYENMTFRGFRKLSSEQVEKDLWALINKDKADFQSMSVQERLEWFGTADVNAFISHYYFGSEV